MRTALLLALLAAAGCEGTNRHANHHHATTLPPAEAPATHDTVVEAARGGSYLGRATCGETHRHTIQMGANETLRLTYRATLSTLEPLGEDVAWRWLGPSGVVLDTNELPVPTPNGPAAERTWEVRAEGAGRYAVAIAVESGSGCTHLSYTLSMQ